MDEFNRQSRLNKFEKRRSNTKKLSILMMIASILILILIAIWIFGGKDKDETSPDTDTPPSESMELEDDVQSADEDTTGSEENESNNDNNQQNGTEENDVIDEEIEVETEQVESSDDNVIEAYSGNWQPIGTIQEGPHTTNYDGGSQDRIEIKQAVMSATGLGEDMVEHWVGNDGHQKVVTTVYDPGRTEIYRVYLTWVDTQGWLVTQVERLKDVQTE